MRPQRAPLPWSAGRRSQRMMAIIFRVYKACAENAICKIESLQKWESISGTCTAVLLNGISQAAMREKTYSCTAVLKKSGRGRGNSEIARKTRLSLSLSLSLPYGLLVQLYSCTISASCMDAFLERKYSCTLAETCR